MIVHNAMVPIVARASQSIARVIAELAAQELERRLAKSGRQSRSEGARSVRTRHSAGEMTKWVADRRARRVPTFVIEATRLDTKKKIVARFGENAAFEKGKPLPPTKLGAPAEPAKLAPRSVKAKPPNIRKSTAAR
jgi:hypothetical protein